MKLIDKIQEIDLDFTIMEVLAVIAIATIVTASLSLIAYSIFLSIT